MLFSSIQCYGYETNTETKIRQEAILKNTGKFQNNSYKGPLKLAKRRKFKVTLSIAVNLSC